MHNHHKVFCHENGVSEVSETFNYMMDILIHKELKENEGNHGKFFFFFLQLDYLSV